MKDFHSIKMAFSALLFMSAIALGGEKCTPFVCPNLSELQANLENCNWLVPHIIPASNEAIGECVIKAIHENSESGMLQIVLTNLNNGKIKKPWASEVLKAIYPLLDQSDVNFRGMYSDWYQLDRQVRGDPAPSLYEKRKLPNGETVMHLKSATAAPGIVKIGSTYLSEQPQKGPLTVEEIGTGNLVSAPDVSPNSSFVLTAAHLVGGANAWVSLNGKKLKIENSLVDNDHDIALIEVQKEPIQALTYSSKTKQFMVSPVLERGAYDQTLPWSAIGIDTGTTGAHPGEKVPKIISDFHRAEVLSAIQNPWTIESPETGFAWGFNSEDSSRSMVGLTFDKTEIRVRSKVKGGASGSFVADFSRGRPYMEGLITQSSYYFNETLLVRHEMLGRLLELYKSGQRGTLGGTTWNMRNGLTYREYANGWSEVNFLDNNTGNWVIADPGNWVIADPGCESMGSAPPRPSPWNDADPAQVLAQFGLEPGMRLRGKPIIAISAVAKKGNVNPSQLLFYADPSALAFMREHADEYTFTPLEYGADLLSPMMQRLGAKGRKINFGAQTGPPRDIVKFNETFDYSFSPDQEHLSVEDGKIKVRLQTYSADRVKKEDPDSADVVEFELDKRGALINSSPQAGFTPIIEVKGERSGETYYVDIRRLFFNDLSEVSLPLESTDPKEAENELRRQLDIYGLEARNAKSGLEFGFTFRPLN